MNTTNSATDLATRIERARVKAATPGYEVYLDPDLIDFEAWNAVGDPLAEALITELRSRKQMGGDIYANARKLEADRNPAAVAFFADVEHIPAWADFEAMRPGAAMGRRNPFEFVAMLHGALTFTYMDPATCRVMNSTGRLAKADVSDFQRRFWETASGFVGALDVDGSKPGGARWERWVRIRLLHTMIRMGIHRSGRWDIPTTIPISQLAVAAATHPFGRYRVNIIRSLGAHVTDEEEKSFSLMWRWVSRIQGANVELLGATDADEFRISKASHEYLYGPDEISREVTDKLIDGLASMRFFRMSRRMHAAIVRRQLAPEYVQTLAGRDIVTDLGLSRDPAADRRVAVLTQSIRGFNQLMRIPPIRRLSSMYGLSFLEYVIDRGLGQTKADYHATPVAGDRG